MPRYIPGSAEFPDQSEVIEYNAMVALKSGEITKEQHIKELEKAASLRKNKGGGSETFSMKGYV